MVQFSDKRVFLLLVGIEPGKAISSFGVVNLAKQLALSESVLIFEMKLSKDARLAFKMTCLRTADYRLQAFPPEGRPFFSVPQGV
ncbi:unnamed protein product [Rodentolepis nana]|uniref:FERM domain-containing protein n=1 Tax=Rodentolepis nana TaxID=102285 RepID=A0A0R3TDZ6_RODNA|nr:unnamed protein product [Rodentolepis nana]